VVLRTAKTLARQAAQALHATSTTRPVVLDDLPDSWDLSNPIELLEAFQKLMPGEWSKTHITRLSKQLPGGANFLQTRDNTVVSTPACIATGLAELKPLMEVVDFSEATMVLDPCSGTGAVSMALKQVPLQVITNDINPQHVADNHEDALQPAFYKRLLAVTTIDVVVVSPWFAHLDLMIPMLMRVARLCVCVHIPGHYFTNAIKTRYQFFEPLVAADRTHFIWGLPRGPMGLRCAWMVIFRTSSMKHRMLKPGTYHATTVSFADMV
jgi:hypothetical protein